MSNKAFKKDSKTKACERKDTANSKFGMFVIVLYMGFLGFDVCVDFLDLDAYANYFLGFYYM